MGGCVAQQSVGDQEEHAEQSGEPAHLPCTRAPGRRQGALGRLADAGACFFRPRGISWDCATACAKRSRDASECPARIRARTVTRGAKACLCEPPISELHAHVGASHEQRGAHRDGEHRGTQRRQTHGDPATGGVVWPRDVYVVPDSATISGYFLGTAWQPVQRQSRDTGCPAAVRSASAEAPALFLWGGNISFEIVALARNLLFSWRPPTHCCQARLTAQGCAEQASTTAVRRWKLQAWAAS